jgi:Domain of unknown function (DUF4382)
MKKIKLILGLLVTIIAMNACEKKTTETDYKYSVRMTDAPGPYDAVYIDLQGVEITGGDGKAISLNVNAGIYNLLNFSNGIDTLIATGGLTDGKVQQIRLILGTNNSVVINGTSYPLSTPSADQTGLKLQVHQTLQSGVQYEMLLDFDANESIVETGSGTYKLKPVIRTIETAISGSIKGKITPAGTMASVAATASGISYSSNVDANGDFIIKGLPAGIYSVTITPKSPLIAATVASVVVAVGVSTNIGPINF